MADTRARLFARKCRSFIVQAPTALFCGVFCMVLLSSKQTDLKKKESPAAGAQIDFLGIGGFTVTIASFLAAMQLWDQQQLGPAAACLAVAVAAGLAFLLVEAYWAAQPLIPLPLLKTSSAVFFALHALLAFGRQAVCLPHSRCLPHPPSHSAQACTDLSFSSSMFRACHRTFSGPKSLIPPTRRCA